MPAGDDALLGERGHPLDERDLLEREVGAGLRALHHLVEVAEQPEAGDVGERVHPELARGEHLAGGAVEGGHHRDHPPRQRGRRELPLDRGGRDPRAERLGEQEQVSRLRARVLEHPLRVDEPGDRHAVLRLGVLHRVAAEDRDPRLVRLLLPAGEDLREHRERVVAREADEVEREDRLRPHRVDVGERVRRGDLAELPRVVDHRREEVDRLHHRELAGQSIHRGVVAGGKAHQRSRVSLRLQPAQDLRQVRGAELRRSARAVAEFGEALVGVLAHARDIRRRVRHCKRFAPNRSRGRPGRARSTRPRPGRFPLRGSAAGALH